MRDCTRFAAVPVDDNPTEDLPASLPRVDGFGLATYAEDEFAADVARTLERRSGALELGRFGATYEEVKNSRRIAIVHGTIVVADGRTDPAFFGGHARLLLDGRRWEEGGCKEKDMPVQVKRLRQLEKAGVDVVEFPTHAAVDLKFSRLNLAQPVVLCIETFRVALANGRVTVKWS